MASESPSPSSLMEALAGTIHDIRQIASLAPHHVLALEKEFNIPTTNRSLGRLRSLVATLESLADTALVADKACEGTLQASKTVEDFCEMAEKAVSFFEPVCRHAGITIGVHIPSPLPLVPLDPALFPRVLQNLLSNAVHVTPDGGAISISASVTGGTFVCQVSDTGPGIQEAEITRIFLPRSRGEGAPYPGSGLGLFVVRSIVEAHGGSVAASNNPTGGAAITVRIPLS